MLIGRWLVIILCCLTFVCSAAAARGGRVPGQKRIMMLMGSIHATATRYYPRFEKQTLAAFRDHLREAHRSDAVITGEMKHLQAFMQRVRAMPPASFSKQAPRLQEDFRQLYEHALGRPLRHGDMRHLG